MHSNDEQGGDRPRPPSADRVPTLTEVVDLAPWAEPAGPSPAPPVSGAAPDAASPFETTVMLPPGHVPHEQVADLQPDQPTDLPDLAGLSLDSGTTAATSFDDPWPAAPPPVTDAAPAPWQDDGQMPAPAQVAPAVLVAQVLDDLAPRIDLLFEAQLREALAPALQRAADALVQDAREQLSAALRTLVEQAVARALQQRDGH